MRLVVACTVIDRNPNGDRNTRSLANEPNDSCSVVPTPDMRLLITFADGSVATFQIATR